MEQQLALNPYKQDRQLAMANPTASTEIETQRALAEVQAAVIMAKKFPRDVVEATDRILNECQRQSLAEQALYTYSRGGTDISGPSIRLAEAIARHWGNIEYGIKELSQSNGESEMLAYAYDLETNTRSAQIFYVKHERNTKARGKYRLEDPRDIYEMTANQAARRLRGRILAIVPGDVVEAAKIQCEQTLKAKADTSPEAVKRMLERFAELNVTQQQIEKRIQRRVDAITPAQIISLRKIYNSLSDGMSGVSDWFEADTVTELRAANESPVEGLKKSLKAKVTKAAEQISPFPCPGDPLGAMTGDKPTESYCGQCSIRDNCDAWPVPE